MSELGWSINRLLLQIPDFRTPSFIFWDFKVWSSLPNFVKCSVFFNSFNKQIKISISAKSQYLTIPLETSLLHPQRTKKTDTWNSQTYVNQEQTTKFTWHINSKWKASWCKADSEDMHVTHTTMTSETKQTWRNQRNTVIQSLRNEIKESSFLGFSI